MRGEEALGNSVVVAVAASALRVLKIVSPYERGPVHAGELRALIRVDQQPLPRLAPPHRQVQRLQHHVGGLSTLRRPPSPAIPTALRCVGTLGCSAHHAAGVQVDHDGQIGEAFKCPNVGDVCHPGPIWRSHVKLAIQCVFDRQ